MVLAIVREGSPRRKDFALYSENMQADRPGA